MTSKERYETLIETGEFDFIKDMPKEQFWKLAFFIFYVYGNEEDNVDKDYQESVSIAIKALEQEDNLDKIRAEIEALEYLNIEDGSDGYDKYIEKYEVLKIIDNYKESKGKK